MLELFDVQKCIWRLYTVCIHPDTLCIHPDGT